MKLQFLPSTYSVCQLKPTDAIPDWATNEFFSVSRTDDELTIMIASEHVADNIKAQHDFACFRVIGKMEFDTTGVIAGISKVIAEASVPILSISTYDTDYFLVANENRKAAMSALIQSGYEFKSCADESH